jgi:serine protease AprX
MQVMDAVTPGRLKCESATWGAKIVVGLLLVLSPILGWGKSKKFSSDLDPAGKGSAMVNVIVQYKVAPEAKHHSKAQAHGANLKHHLDLVRGTAMSIPANQLQSLVADDPDIAYVSPDRPLQGADGSGYTDAFVAVNGNIAANYTAYSGKGIGVAIIDSGIAGGPGMPADLKDSAGHNRVVFQQDFTGQGLDDQYGHGTHVAGIIGGIGKQSTCASCFRTYYGIADGVNFISLKALNSNGSGSDSSVIAAIQAAIANKTKYNIRVINLSLGRGVFESYQTDPLTQAAEQAWKAGIVVVVAAGNYGRDNSNNNNGYGTITSPGNDPYVITVGAMRTMGTQSRADDVIATYSSKGPSMLDHVMKPDLVAPGNQIVSVLSPHGSLQTLFPSTYVKLNAYQNTTNTGNSNSYLMLSGTSMAAPVVSGAAAMLLEQNPALTPDQVKARLMKTANKNLVLYSSYTDPITGVTFNEQSDAFTVGAGYVDVWAALNNSDLAPSATGVAKSPTVTFDPITGQVSMVEDDSVVWGSSVLWGSSVVWGSSVIWGSNTSGQSVLWGSSVVWGSSTNNAFSVIWGSSTLPMSVLWGSNAGSSDASSVLVNGDN